VEELRRQKRQVERVRQLGEEGQSSAEDAVRLGVIVNGLVQREQLVEKAVGRHRGLDIVGVDQNIRILGPRNIPVLHSTCKELMVLAGMNLYCGAWKWEVEQPAWACIPEAALDLGTAGLGALTSPAWQYPVLRTQVYYGSMRLAQETILVHHNHEERSSISEATNPWRTQRKEYF
jgi:hypothetical protein